MKKRIDRFITNSSVVTVEVEIEGDEDSFHGIPVRRSGTLLAFQELDQFHFDGFKIIRLEDIASIRRGKEEIVRQQILKHSGELANLSCPPWLDIVSWKRLLTALQQERMCVCVESSLVDVDLFAIGEVSRIGAESVTLKSFDAQGSWNKPRHLIRYADITEISFGDEYSVTFSEFVKSSRTKRRRRA